MPVTEIDYRRVYKELKKNEQARRRADLQAERHAKRPMGDLINDQVRLRVIEFVQSNPLWTPEDLVRIINYFKRYYGLTKRYAVVEGNKDGDDLGTTQGSSETPS